MKAIVIHGIGRGKKMGFPTLNLKIDKCNLPPNGIYAVDCSYEGKKYRGVGSIGTNPTFEDKGFSVEIYLFDFDKDIAGQVIEVNFIFKIRDEKKFDTVNELIEKIKDDVKQAEEYFRSIENE